MAKMLSSHQRSTFSSEKAATETARSQSWQRRNPRGTWSSRLKTFYSITADEYELILWHQGGGCALCGAQTSGAHNRPRLFVDHDHSRCCPGYRSCRSCVRGLLCLRCNVHPSGDGKRLARFQEYLKSPPAQEILP